MTKLLLPFVQVLLLTGLLISLILDMPAWEISFPVRGLAFLILIAFDWTALNQLIEAGISKWEREAETKIPLPMMSDPNDPYDSMNAEERGEAHFSIHDGEKWEHL